MTLDIFYPWHHSNSGFILHVRLHEILVHLCSHKCGKITKFHSCEGKQNIIFIIRTCIYKIIWQQTWIAVHKIKFACFQQRQALIRANIFTFTLSHCSTDTTICCTANGLHPQLVTDTLYTPWHGPMNNCWSTSMIESRTPLSIPVHHCRDYEIWTKRTPGQCDKSMYCLLDMSKSKPATGTCSYYWQAL